MGPQASVWWGLQRPWAWACIADWARPLLACNKLHVNNHYLSYYLVNSLLYFCFDVAIAITVVVIHYEYQLNVASMLFGIRSQGGCSIRDTYDHWFFEERWSQHLTESKLHEMRC